MHSKAAELFVDKGGEKSSQTDLITLSYDFLQLYRSQGG